MIFTLQYKEIKSGLSKTLWPCCKWEFIKHSWFKILQILKILFLSTRSGLICIGQNHWHFQARVALQFHLAHPSAKDDLTFILFANANSVFSKCGKSIKLKVHNLKKEMSFLFKIWLNYSPPPSENNIHVFIPFCLSLIKFLEIITNSYIDLQILFSSYLTLISFIIFVTLQHFWNEFY